MKIIDIINQNKPILSFEVFPPKTSTAFENVKAATEKIAALSPAFMSVTYGAGGGTSEFTLEIAKNLKNNFGVEPLEHLTCVSSSKETVHKRLEEIKEAGIENIMALRGDMPQEFSPEDIDGLDYHYATELINDIKAFNPSFCLGGACYPEIHPESANRNEDIIHLKEKVDAGVEFLTTQMFFDNNLLFNFLYRIREKGINVPVVAGIMPITNAKQIERTIKLSGSHIPQRYKHLLDVFGTNPGAMEQAGIIYATDQIIDLFANGINAVHVYTMNKPDVAAKIQANLSEML